MQESNIVTFQTDWKGITYIRKTNYMNLKDPIYFALNKTHSNLSHKTRVYFDITIPMSDNHFIVDQIKITVTFIKKDSFIPSELLRVLLKQSNFVLVSLYGQEPILQLISRHSAFDGYSIIYRKESNKLLTYCSYVITTATFSMVITSYLNALHLWKTQSIPSSIWPSTYLQLENFS